MHSGDDKNLMLELLDDDCWVVPLAIANPPVKRVNFTIMITPITCHLRNAEIELSKARQK